ncbi:MAG: 50S ribosomal protein L17 [Elusimicrobiota bacterium]|nr:50S ribosomal protein L17 [Elusimicrobiota bacterium]
MKTYSHRKAMLRNMTTSLILSEKIKTTLQKAKLLRSFAEKIINTAKEKNLTAYRKVASEIKNKQAINKLFTVLAERYATRIGGYVQISRIGFRQGDAAEIVLVKLAQ